MSKSFRGIKRYITWVGLVFLWGCGAGFPPANSDGFVQHTFAIGQANFSILLPPELQQQPPEFKGSVVVLAHEGRDRTREHIMFTSIGQASKADFVKTVTLNNSGTLRYGIFDRGNAGSGGPEQMLIGNLDIGEEQIRVQCSAQAEWQPEPHWCIPLLHHLSQSEISQTTRPPLIELTLAGNTEEVRQLLRQGADPNLTYRTNTALTYAARDGFNEIARLLIDHGADVNWIDGEGVTPLILASFKDNIDLVQLLLDHGADITVRDQWNRTALDYALRRGEADPIVQLLQTQE